MESTKGIPHRAKETIDANLLPQISSVLKIPVEEIQNFDEEKVMNIISNTFTSNDTPTLNAVSPNWTFNINPVEKWLESLDEIKQLHAKLLKEKDEKMPYTSVHLKKRRNKGEIKGDIWYKVSLPNKCKISFD